MPTTVSKRSHSAVLDAILATVGIKPAIVHAAISNRRRSGGYALIDGRDRFGAKLVPATTANQLSISRPRDTLFLQLNHLVPGSPWWRYEERTRTDINFSLAATIPNTLLAASRGRKLGDIVPTGFLDHLVISGAAAIPHGTEFKLRASWL